MPRPAVVVVAAAPRPGRRARRGVRPPAPPVHHAADQRMGEGHLARRRSARVRTPRPPPAARRRSRRPARGGDHRQLGPGVRRGDQQCPPRGPGQRADPARERALQPAVPARAGARARRHRRAGRRSASRAARPGPADCPRRPARSPLATGGASSGARCRSSSAAAASSTGPTGSSGSRTRSGGYHGSRAASTTASGPPGPPGDVLDALAGGRVDPLDVVHHGEHRAVLGRGPQHAERGDADREPVTGRGRPQRQRAHERRRLRCRQRVQLGAAPGPEKSASAEKASSASVSAPQARSTVTASPAALDQRLEQRRLADPGLSVHDQRAALAACERGEESRRAGLSSAARLTIIAMLRRKERTGSAGPSARTPR